MQGGRSEDVCSRPGCGRPLSGKQTKWCSPACYWRVWDAAHPRVDPRNLPAPVRQRALPGESRVERAFTAWIGTPEGRYVEREVVRLAREDKAAGDRRGELNLYLALVRRSARGLRRDPAGFRCNNSFRSFLARKVMAENVDLAGFFEVRPLRGRV